MQLRVSSIAKIRIHHQRREMECQLAFKTEWQRDGGLLALKTESKIKMEHRQPLIAEAKLRGEAVNRVVSVAI